ncbi:COQ9 family protein [Pseudorhodobacter sp.]|uniref:COQ9 family protein n=1 Tax=Pseudorhodobacter sp. TaxID=1934400 RepID=UPI002649BFF2|nr:COQ9 family protein [Pseudorhodobacter sp.]MDN5785502.1 COQ9 family protein [Pseudorhodobacter sp.]
METKENHAEPESQQENGVERAKQAILQAAIPHVAFEGWSDASFRAAIADSEVAPGLASALYPRGGLDLALEFHRRGDTDMVEKLAATDLTNMRYTARVAYAIHTRLADADRELVRRGTTLFALPQNAAEGARAIWGTADAIWKALGDTSTDFNWYTKRMTLSGVYASTVLFWLGDDSPGNAATWDFLDRRLADVGQFEKFKAGLRDNPLTRSLREGPFSSAFAVFDKVRMPGMPRMPDDLPGRYRR